MMLIMPNHHVIVPRTDDRTYVLNTIITDERCRRNAHVQHFSVSNVGNIQLDFTPLSDQWLEIYIDGYRLVNPRYGTYETPYARYETYNMAANNTVRFGNVISGNVTVVCDTQSHTFAEIRTQANVSGVTMRFDNIQNYDVFEKRFNPSRYPMANLDLRNSIIRIRIGDGLYAEPQVLAQPCYGFVRPTMDRKSLVYVPRPGFQGWDAFGYTLMSQHGQMGKPATITVKTWGEDLRYAWSADFDGQPSTLAFRDNKNSAIAALAGRQTTFEFYFYTRSVDNSLNFRQGIFGQYSTIPKAGRFAVYLQATSTTSDQVLVVQFTISGFTITGDPVYNDYRVSSRARFQQQRWHHAVIQIDATNSAQARIALIVDGYREDTVNLDFTAQNVITGDGYLLGAVNDMSTSQFYKGYISNFRVITNQLPYSGERIAIPRRPLANVANVKILTVNTGIQDPQSVHDAADWSRTIKVGNVRMVEFSPFSPTILSSSRTEIMHGETITIRAHNDYICKYSRVPWTINAAVSVGAVNDAYRGANVPIITASTIDEAGVTANVTSGMKGVIIVDDCDRIDITVDTHANLMTTARRFDFTLDQWPLMIETVNVLADPDGLVLDIIATNDGFARDHVNFNHGTLTSLGAYNASLGGYFTFNGTTDQILGAHNRAIDLVNDVTLEVWFRIQNPSPQQVLLFGKSQAGSLSYGLYYDTTANRYSYERDYTEGNICVEWTDTVSIVGTWQQIAAVSESGQHKIYKNGVKVHEESIDVGPYLSSLQGYRIGSGSGSDFHNGQVSIVKVYNRARTTAEILANFNLYRARYGL